MTRIFPLLTALLLTASSAAMAQPSSVRVAHQQRGIQRDGFLIGFSLGGGAIDCDGCTDLSGAAFDFHVGGMVRPDLALMFDASGVASTMADDSIVAHAVDTFAVQYWPTSRFWLKGGLGLGMVRVTDSAGDEVARSHRGVGLMAGAGYEVLQGDSFALDVQLRVASVTYDDDDREQLRNTSLAVGFNWY